MPATRTPAHQTMVSFHDAGPLNQQSYEAQPDKGAPTKAPTRDVSEPTTVPPTRKRKHSPNAFILFRSFIIANKLLPPEITHQNDVSRYIAELWKSAPVSDRNVFFMKAKAEKLREEIEGPGEVYRTKRVRTRKVKASKAAEPNKPLSLPASPAAASGSSTSSPMPFSLSSDMAGANGNQFIFPPTMSVPFGTPSIAVPETPQVVAATPPSLPSWDNPTETQIIGGHFYTHYNTSFLLEAPSFLPLPYDVNYDIAFQNHFDSVLSLDANTSSHTYSGADFLSPSSHEPFYRSSFPSFEA